MSSKGGPLAGQKRAQRGPLSVAWAKGAPCQAMGHPDWPQRPEVRPRGATCQAKWAPCRAKGRATWVLSPHYHHLGKDYCEILSYPGPTLFASQSSRLSKDIFSHDIPSKLFTILSCFLTSNMVLLCGARNVLVGLKYYNSNAFVKSVMPKDKEPTLTPFLRSQSV